MITAQLSRRRRSYRVFLSGHADYEPGNDIVCAAVSALVWAWLTYACSRRVRWRERVLEKGRARLVCRGGARLRPAFASLALGLEQIARQYPRHLRFASPVTDKEG